MAGQQEAKSQDLQFVYVSQASASVRKENARIARAHAAKLNRDKYKEKLAKRRQVDDLDQIGGPSAVNDPDLQSFSQTNVEAYPKLAIRAILDEHLFTGNQAWSHDCDDPKRCIECLHRTVNDTTQLQRRRLDKQMQLTLTAALDTLPPEVQQWSLGTMSNKARHHRMSLASYSE